jgi:hypothetical protein
LYFLKVSYITNFNKSKSQIIHEETGEALKFLVQNHQRLDEATKLWSVEDVNVIAGKINGLKLPAYIIMKMIIGDFGGVVSELGLLNC